MTDGEKHPEDKEDTGSSIEKSVSRREFLKIAVAGAAVGLGVGFGGALAACGGTAAPTTTAAVTPATTATTAPSATTAVSSSAGAGAPQPTDAADAVVEAIAGYPLVGLGEVHMNQQFHDFLGALLPKLPGRVNDIVVEFGNAHYQDVADRFVLDLEPVGSDELAQIWRTAVGGLVLWDAPVYEHFYRSTRTLNASLPAAQRIRVLLGDPDVDWAQVRSAADRDKIPTEAQREPFFAGVVEHEVLARGHRALLIAGADHLRRYEYASPGGFNPSPDARQPNVATLLSDARPGSLYLIFPLAGRSPGSPDITKVDAAFAGLATSVDRARCGHLARHRIGDISAGRPEQVRVRPSGRRRAVART